MRANPRTAAVERQLDFARHFRPFPQHGRERAACRAFSTRARRLRAGSTSAGARAVRYDGISVRAELSRRMGLTDTGFDAVFKRFGHSPFSDSRRPTSSGGDRQNSNFSLSLPDPGRGCCFRLRPGGLSGRSIWTPAALPSRALGGICRDFRLRGAVGGRCGSRTASSLCGARGRAVPLDAARGRASSCDCGRRAGRSSAHRRASSLAERGRGLRRRSRARSTRWRGRSRTRRIASSGAIATALQEARGVHEPYRSRAVGSITGLPPAWRGLARLGRKRSVAACAFEAAHATRFDDARDPDHMEGAADRGARRVPRAARDEDPAPLPAGGVGLPGFPVGRGVDQPGTTTAVPGIISPATGLRRGRAGGADGGAVASGIAAADGSSPRRSSRSTRSGRCRRRRATRRVADSGAHRARSQCRVRSSGSTARPCACSPGGAVGTRSPGLRELLLIAFATFPLNLLVYALDLLHDRASRIDWIAQGRLDRERAMRAAARCRNFCRAGVAAQSAIRRVLRGDRAVALVVRSWHSRRRTSSPRPAARRRCPKASGLGLNANAGYCAAVRVRVCLPRRAGSPWRETIAFAVWTFGAPRSDRSGRRRGPGRGAARSRRRSVQASALVVAIVSYLVAFSW